MEYKFCFKKDDNIEKRGSSFFCGISTREGISANPLELELAERIIRGFINDIKGFSVSLDEIFTSLKISCRDCILLGMPIYYEKVSNRYVRDSDGIYYYAHKRQICGTRHYLNSGDSLELIKNKFGVDGALEINLSVYGDFRGCYSLLIGGHNSIFLFDGENTELYMIYKLKRTISISEVFSIRRSGLWGKDIPTIGKVKVKVEE